MKYQEAKMVFEAGSATLDLPELPIETELPTVSVVTVLESNPNPMNYLGTLLASWSGISAIYSKKIQWIILDTCENSMEPYIPSESNIKYYRATDVPKDTPLYEKWNIANSFAGGEYITHLHYTNYYFPDSVLAKIRVLKKYEPRECVFSWETGIYDLITRESFIVYKPEQDKIIDFSGALYTKRYWEAHKFTNNPEDFVKKRSSKFVTISFLFNCFKIITESDPKLTTPNENLIVKDARFQDVITDSVIDILENQRELLI